MSEAKNYREFEIKKVTDSGDQWCVVGPLWTTFLSKGYFNSQPQVGDTLKTEGIIGHPFARLWLNGALIIDNTRDKANRTANAVIDEADEKGSMSVEEKARLIAGSALKNFAKWDKDD